ncbi:MAG: bifunctional (p)ppGpp synthetase/guanosine-3',5'-bis(diphosphate) 3'-pyrophosphohydrolase [Rhodospirillales bacterium]
MIRQFELVERIKSYDPQVNEEAINRAYVYAIKMHGSQKRASGDPYFSHPLEVAGILSEFKLDSASIITGLLHDVIEDTETSLADVERHFGSEVARLVNGVTKLSRLEIQSEDTSQAENFRKLLLAMSEDIRVLLIKLADRLHNMRTLHFIKSPKKRQRIARETMDIYAPLSERLGMHGIKDELEDLAFGELNPEARNSILKRLVFLREQGSDRVSKTADELKATLRKAGLKAVVVGREKRPFSIWRKMQRQNIPFELMSDIVAFRVIVDFEEDCYRALGVFHRAYSVVPGLFDDYISTPKPNGYRSIHTVVIGPGKTRIEIQIRTREMHDIAEHGVAAHWMYKQDADKSDGRQFRWLQGLLEILDQAGEPEEFLEHTKLEMYRDQVFCFTPKGDLINLPQGSTPVDFAYAVHTEIGDRCVGSKINGKMMPLKTELRNGDQVEIVISQAQTPSPMWEQFVATGKARARIRRFIRLKQRDEYIQIGHAILERLFFEEGYEMTRKGLKGVLKKFSSEDVDTLYADVGAGLISGRDVLEAVFPRLKRKKKENGENVVPLDRARKKGKKSSSLPIKGLIPGMALHYGDCCNPLPGERIVGIVSPGKGVTIHTIDCDSLEEFSNHPDRWLDVRWDVDENSPSLHNGRLYITVLNEPGSLASLSTVIAKNDGNISNLKTTRRSPEFFELTVDVEVRDVKHLTEIIAALRATPEINNVERARG